MMAKESPILVKINVGGTWFETSRSTVDKLGSGYFAKAFSTSDDSEDGRTRAVNGSRTTVFVDRDPESFRILLNAAREVGEEGELVDMVGFSKGMVDMLERDVKFYQLGLRWRNAIGKLRGAAGDRLKVNVGGSLFETTRSTIDKLGSDRLSQRLLAASSKQASGEEDVPFVDRDPDCFKIILNMARYGEIVNAGGVTVDTLEREAEFYQLNDACRSLIRKMRVQRNETAGTRAGKVRVNTDVSPESLYHHVHLKIADKGGIIYGHDDHLECTHKSCFSTSLTKNAWPVCCICGTPAVDGKAKVGSETVMTDWCHRCRRCLRCADTTCFALR